MGACTAFLSLSVDAVRTTAVALGTGTIKSAHGIYPLPAPPATLAILRNGQIPVRYTNEERELCTPPTGAALLAEFMATGRDEIPPLTWGMSPPWGMGRAPATRHTCPMYSGHLSVNPEPKKKRTPLIFLRQMWMTRPERSLPTPSGV
ncbi:nickel insertion protein [Methanogenium cariaci]|uniref:nickel insertion protein n=1 Tax=Methanogenium cariaci TaxID=2197 RepID=UPI0024806641|nr:nickel insertion protein [Methanogenium cariaci]